MLQECFYESKIRKLLRKLFPVLFNFVTIQITKSLIIYNMTRNATYIITNGSPQLIAFLSGMMKSFVHHALRQNHDFVNNFSQKRENSGISVTKV